MPQEKLKLDPNYYPPDYIPDQGDALVLVDNLVPAPTPGKDERRKENTQKKDTKTH